MSDLNQLTFQDKDLVNKFLKLSEHNLSVYAFTNIYIWRKLYHIYWQLIKDNLCVFFQDKIGFFMYLAPLGSEVNGGIIEEAFRIMDSFNKNKDISRIENVEEKDAGLYQQMGFECQHKSCDYVWLRTDLADLKGDKFKSKRAGFNYFIKHYPDSEYFPFDLKYKESCLELFDFWAEERKNKLNEPLYCGMIDDSLLCLKQLFEAYFDLDITGRLVKIGGKIKAFTLGYELKQNTFCILYEITDLSVKGLAQFIFRKFCSELTQYSLINIMDDSGLENLKRVKLSYHPVNLSAAYIAKRRL